MRFFKSPHLRLLAHNLLILAGGEVVTRALTTVAFVYLARVLEPAFFGLVEFTLAVMMFLNLLVLQGFGTLGARETARHPKEVEPIVSRIVSAQVMLSIIIYVLFAFVILYLPIERTLTLLLLGYGLSILGIPFLLSWVFQGRNQMIWVALPQMLRYTIFLLVVLLLIKTREQILLLPLAEIAAVYTTAITLIIVYIRSGERLEVSLRAACDRRLFAESLPIGGSEIIWVFRMYLPTIMIGLLASKAGVGLFGSAHRIVMVFQAMLGVYFINIFPTMSQASLDSKERFSNLLHRSLQLVICPSLALALSMIFVAPTVIYLIFGEHYVRPEGIGTLMVLIWIIPILAWRRHGRSALITLHHQREDLVGSLIGVVLLVLLLIPLTLAYGPIGSAWAMIASELVATVFIWMRLKTYVPTLRPLKCLFSIPSLKYKTGA